jgi:ABC-type lipoprotein release transport system permease subunit
MVLTLAAYFVFALATLASFISARRAAEINPMQALRGH